MAISIVHYLLVRDFALQGGLRPGGAILEIGEANWYGDVSKQSLIDDAHRFVSDPARRQAILARIEAVEKLEPTAMSFEVPKIFYEIFYAPCEHQAIDFHGTPIAQKLDLNMPIRLSRQFDVVMNHGTAEHVFNIGQVYRTIHEVTAPGGLMIHEGPFFGWVDHGFYTMQPTLFFDLAIFNQYLIHGLFITEITSQVMIAIRSRDEIYELAKDKRIPENAQLFVVMRKAATEQPFQMPIQGYYGVGLSEKGMTAWRQLR